jgi:RNA-directed DNA polymerase
MNRQKSAEAIVSRRKERRAEQWRFRNLEETRGKRRKQTILVEAGSYPCEDGVESRRSEEGLSIPLETKRRRDDRKGDEEGLFERILSRENLNKAYKRVVSNKGSQGVDGMKVDELLPYLKQNGDGLRQELLEGKYHPQPVRRVEIPKADGGVRLIGIPTVVDRMIQQAIAQELNKEYDPEFSESSYGFRPKRSAHQAVKAARRHIGSGREWVVDIDLEKFFDRVNHGRLLEEVGKKVEDKRVLELIRKYLESGIMLNGVKVKNEEGTPQGGPLSPLLANIVLDDLDKELERRGHKFCRYADDCNIYVGSRSAGERVMKSITRYIEGKLKLKVNRSKSAVDKPNRRKFLGFSFYTKKGEVRNFVHKKPIERLKKKVREITGRSNGRGMEWRKEALKNLIRGWVNYFRIADMKTVAAELDQWIRRRIRMCYWKQWKKIRTKRDELVKLGLDKRKAWEYANTRKSYWRTSGSYILSKTLTNKYLEEQGFVSLTKRLSEC